MRPNLPTTKNAKTPRSLAGGRGANTTKAKNQSVAANNLGAKSSKIKRRLGRQMLKIAYRDKHGQPREEVISGKTARIFLKLWWKRTEGLTQAGVPKGFTLRTYVYDLATNEKSGYFMVFKRIDHPNTENGHHRSYHLATDVRFLAEIGFSEIRSHLTQRKG